MESKKNTEMLAGWIMNVAVLGLILGACWYFRSVLVYILAAFVVSLLGHPLMELMRKIKVRGKQLPDALLAVITILVILGVLSFTVTQIIPVVLHIVREASVMNTQNVLLITPSSIRSMRESEAYSPAWDPSLTS